MHCYFFNPYQKILFFIIKDNIILKFTYVSTQVVRKFMDILPYVFSMDLLGIPMDYDIAFAIDVKPDSKFIFIPPYRMTLAKLKTLKEQLQDLLGKGFVRPSVFPWGALVLFVMKKGDSMHMCIDYVVEQGVFYPS